MKSIEIKSLIALLVITMTLSASIMRETKAASKTTRKSKAKTTTTSDGSGSWAQGYNCPFIEVLNSQQTVINTSPRWSFKPTTINSAKGFGFVMDDAVPAELAAFVQVSNGEKYVPWRFFDNVTYGKQFASYKMIVAIVRNDQGAFTTLRFNLPWARFSDYITVSQVNHLISTISNFADQQKNNIQANKSNIITQFGQMEAATKAQASAAQNEAQLKAATEANIQKNQALLAEKRTAMKTMDIQINSAKPIISQFQAQADKLASDRQALEQEYDNNEKLIDDKARAQIFKNIDVNIKKELEDVVVDITLLGKQCANYQMAGVIAAAQSGSTSKVTELLLAIQPL